MVTNPQVNAQSFGGSAGAFLRMGQGALNTAMGDCGTGFGEEGSWYYNPASLPEKRRRTVTIEYRTLTMDRSLSYIGFTTPIRPNAALGVGYLRAAVDDIDARDSNGNRYDLLSWSDNLIHGTFALQPHPSVALGVTVKWMINAIPDALEDGKNLYAYGMGVDLGVRVRVLPELNLGAQIRDLNGKHSWDTSDVWGDSRGTHEDAVPLSLRYGVVWTPLFNWSFAMDVLITPDMTEVSEQIKPHFGVQYWYPFGTVRSAFARAGWNGRTPAFGLGLVGMFGRMGYGLDYAYAFEPVTPDGSHLITWKFML